jgi:hypothetical protein
MNLSQGVALGYYISRLWRWESDFCHNLLDLPHIKRPSR